MYVCVHTWRFQQWFHMRFVFMQSVSRYLFMWYRQIYQGFSSERKILSLSILTILAHISNLFICGCFLCKRSLLTPLVRRRCFCHPLDFLHRKPWFIYFSKLFYFDRKRQHFAPFARRGVFSPSYFLRKRSLLAPFARRGLSPSCFCTWKAMVYLYFY